MTNSYELPEPNKKAFTCPYCRAYAAMDWEILVAPGQFAKSFWKSMAVLVANCHHCKKNSIWFNEEIDGVYKMVYPKPSEAPLPALDLPEDCHDDYMEARSIVGYSPRGAAALLRLCVQKLMPHIGGAGENINVDIGMLVKQGLPVNIQQALDYVRVIGNNAVHPGEININDQPQTAMMLFGLINLIVEHRITQPKQVAALYSSLPDGSKTAIIKRDRKE